MSVISFGVRDRVARARPASLRRVAGLPTGVLLGGSIVLILVLGAILAPVLAPYSATSGSISQRLFDVGSAGHVLGTDGQGRDVLSRLIWGARPTLIAGVLPVVIGGLI